MHLSPRYTDAEWKACFAGKDDWNTAINIVEDRIKGRWLDAVDLLLGERYLGFAILALDCIVLESLWGFMNGKAVPKGHEQQVYREIFTSVRFGWTAGQTDSFRQFVRNGVIHDAETRKGWLIARASPSGVVPQTNPNGGYKLNRTKFHHALTATFNDWIAKLRAGDAASCAKMRDRMNQIIKKHYAR
jgi:hypothetical protein